MEHADELLDRLVNDPGEPSGVVANELLAQFFRGYPIDNLRRLLGSKDPRVLGVGVWLASELGSRGAPLLDDVASLLRHELPDVRYYAIDSVLTSATRENGGALAELIWLMEDSHHGVRRKAIDAVSRASPEQLHAALTHLERAHGPGAPAGVGAESIEGLRWLLGAHAANADSVVSMLEDASPALRKFALAAALRMSRLDEGPLRTAADSDDGAIRDVARSELKMMDKLPPGARSGPR